MKLSIVRALDEHLSALPAIESRAARLFEPYDVVPLELLRLPEMNRVVMRARLGGRDDR